MRKVDGRQIDDKMFVTDVATQGFDFTYMLPYEHGEQLNLEFEVLEFDSEDERIRAMAEAIDALDGCFSAVEVTNCRHAGVWVEHYREGHLVHVDEYLRIVIPHVHKQRRLRERMDRSLAGVSAGTKRFLSRVYESDMPLEEKWELPQVQECLRILGPVRDEIGYPGSPMSLMLHLLSYCHDWRLEMEDLAAWL